MEIDITNHKLNIGAAAPDFNLKGVDNSTYSLDSFPADVLVIMFTCNHCPYVQANESRLIKIQEDYKDKNVQLVAINSNSAITHPQDDFEHMVERAKEKEYNFAYLHDESQETAKAYGAQLTPEVFVFDADRMLVYHGRVDDNYENESDVASHDLRNGIDAAINKTPASVPETAAVGCSIKWAPEE